MKEINPFTEKVLEIISSIPEGKVASYGGIAAMAGNPKGARTVVWILRSYSRKEELPWFRVINSKGRISLPEGSGYEVQRKLLENEGIEFNLDGSIDMKKYQWVTR